MQVVFWFFYNFFVLGRRKNEIFCWKWRPHKGLAKICCLHVACCKSATALVLANVLRLRFIACLFGQTSLKYKLAYDHFLHVAWIKNWNAQGARKDKSSLICELRSIAGAAEAAIYRGAALLMPILLAHWLAGGTMSASWYVLWAFCCVERQAMENPGGLAVAYFSGKLAPYFQNGEKREVRSW